MSRLGSLARTIWFVVTLQCEQADRIRANLGDPAVTRADRFAERVHSTLCSSCRNARRQAEQIQDALSDLASGGSAEPTGEPMPADARARIAARLRSADADESSGGLR
ncbi:MAG: hypothetical protein AAFX79_03420 [Planctomycetota bacterium]